MYQLATAETVAYHRLLLIKQILKIHLDQMDVDKTRLWDKTESKAISIQAGHVNSDGLPETRAANNEAINFDSNNNHSSIQGKETESISTVNKARPKPKWKASVLQHIQKGNLVGHVKGGKQSVLDHHPGLNASIAAMLKALRAGGAPLTVVTMHAVMITMIMVMHPKLLETPSHNGSTFKVSDGFVRKWAEKHLNWTKQKATKAAQKLPGNWEEQCKKSALRKAWSIKEYDIPSALYINSDQMQVVYTPAPDETSESGLARTFSCDRYPQLLDIDIKSTPPKITRSIIKEYLNAVWDMDVGRLYRNITLCQARGASSFTLNESLTYELLNDLIGDGFDSDSDILKLPDPSAIRRKGNKAGNIAVPSREKSGKIDASQQKPPPSPPQVSTNSKSPSPIDFSPDMHDADKSPTPTNGQEPRRSLRSKRAEGAQPLGVAASEKATCAGTRTWKTHKVVLAPPKNALPPTPPL
ncbi:hypothetical protein H1R20_g12726, partial [Candolleomyces eurysporus]